MFDNWHAFSEFLRRMRTTARTECSGEQHDQQQQQQRGYYNS